MSCETQPVECSNSFKDPEEQTVYRFSETIDQLRNWSNFNIYKIVTRSTLNETVNELSETVDWFSFWSNPTAIKQ